MEILHFVNINKKNESTNFVSKKALSQKSFVPFDLSFDYLSKSQRAPFDKVTLYYLLHHDWFKKNNVNENIRYCIYTRMIDFIQKHEMRMRNFGALPPVIP